MDAQFHVEKHVASLCVLLKNYFKCWDNLSSHTQVFDSIFNQIDQRDAVNKANLTGTLLGDIPNFKVELLAKIDAQVTRLLLEVEGDIFAMFDNLINLQSTYSKLGRVINQALLRDPAVSKVLCATNRRPSIGDLMTKVDSILMKCQQNIQQKKIIISEIDPENIRSQLQKMQEIWKLPFKMRQDFEAVIVLFA